MSITIPIKRQTSPFLGKVNNSLKLSEVCEFFNIRKTRIPDNMVDITTKYTNSSTNEVTTTNNTNNKTNIPIIEPQTRNADQRSSDLVWRELIQHWLLQYI
jgi:hypothetical protein